MPKPRPNEKESEYISRCVSVVMGEGSPKDQALGKCYGMWRNYKRAELVSMTIKSLQEQIRKEQAIQIIDRFKPEIMAKARRVGGYESPEPGDLPEGGKDLLARVYASCRADGGSKEKCSRIAWSAVNNAGYKAGSPIMLMKSLERELTSLLEIPREIYKGGKVLPPGTRRRWSDGRDKKQPDGQWKRIGPKTGQPPKEGKPDQPAAAPADQKPAEPNPAEQKPAEPKPATKPKTGEEKYHESLVNDAAEYDTLEEYLEAKNEGGLSAEYTGVMEPDKILPIPGSPTFDENRVQIFMKRYSMGVKQKPIELMEEEGKFYLVTGMNKLEALKRLGEKEIPVTILVPQYRLEQAFKDSRGKQTKALKPSRIGMTKDEVDGIEILEEGEDQPAEEAEKDVIPRITVRGSPPKA